MPISVLSALLSVSLTTSIIILGLKLLSPVMNRRYTAKWKYWIWLVLALRLLMPFSITLPQAPIVLSVPDARIALPKAAPVVSVDTATMAAQVISAAPTEATVTEAESMHIAPEEGISLLGIAGTAWLIGVSLFLFWQLASYFAYRKRILRWSHPVRDERTLHQYSALCAQMRIRSRIRLLVCERVLSPQMIGYIRPMLLLPSEDEAMQDEAYILRHELVHFQRRDLWYKLLLTLANALHWFNPLAYLMVREACADLELSCDDIVIRGANFDERKAYSETILASIRDRHRETTLLTTNFHGGVNTMKHRFFNILTPKRRRNGFAPLTVVIAALLAVGLLVGGGPGMAQQYQGPSTSIQRDDDPWTNAELYARYAPYGLSYNTTNDRLYYQGQLVRYFEDMYPIDEYGSAGVLSQHIDGIIDVHGVRDLSNLTHNPDGSFDPSGILIGVEPYTQAEFDRRTGEITAPQQGHAAVSVAGDSGGDSGYLAAIYAIYAPYGLTYDRMTDRLYYNGKAVRHFLDVLTSNGESLTGGLFKGTMRKWSPLDGKGELDVHAVRDAQDRLTGVEMDSQAEYDQRTRDWALRPDSVAQVTEDSGINIAQASADTLYIAEEPGTGAPPSTSATYDAPPSAASTQYVAEELGTVMAQDAAGTRYQASADDAQSLKDYTDKAWKMDYPQLSRQAETWVGRVFLCDGPVVEIISGTQTQLLAMDVSAQGEEPQIVLLENRTNVSPIVGQQYSAYADVSGSEFYENERCPKLIVRYMLGR